ncbi:hypothetical protein DES47_11731 [Roseateles toxinivorans]|uniref:Uncharacterized protein n=1 Tax=Roseateles toxinivorans TaxID=270368 RepID=A0A4R6QCY8_9BURK|nr:hypothetical protein DES47_11731 [Roseateles toxinivorans]
MQHPAAQWSKRCRVVTMLLGLVWILVLAPSALAQTPEPSAPPAAASAPAATPLLFHNRRIVDFRASLLRRRRPERLAARRHARRGLARRDAPAAARGPGEPRVRRPAPPGRGRRLLRRGDGGGLSADAPGVDAARQAAGPLGRAVPGLAWCEPDPRPRRHLCRACAAGGPLHGRAGELGPVLAAAGLLDHLCAAPVRLHPALGRALDGLAAGGAGALCAGHRRGWSRRP